MHLGQETVTVIKFKEDAIGEQIARWAPHPEPDREQVEAWEEFHQQKAD